MSKTNPTILLEFGKWLRGKIEDKKMKQGEAARKAGISRVHLARILSGDTGYSHYTIEAIAKGLNLNLEETLRRAGFAPAAADTEVPVEFVRFKELPPEAQEIIRKHIEALAEIYKDTKKQPD